MERRRFSSSRRTSFHGATAWSRPGTVEGGTATTVYCVDDEKTRHIFSEPTTIHCWRSQKRVKTRNYCTSECVRFYRSDLLCCPLLGLSIDHGALFPSARSPLANRSLLRQFTYPIYLGLRLFKVTFHLLEL